LVSELDRVANEVEQHLGDAALVPTPARQVLGDFDLERDPLLGRQQLDRAADAVHHILERIIGERKVELASF
jgi:hypothetical protein